MNTQRRIVHRELLADAVTPVGAYREIARARGGPSFLLESALGAGVGARRSLIGVGARGEVRAVDGRVSLAVDGRERPVTDASPLEACRELLSALLPAPEDVERSPFFGLFGAAAHELSGYFERLPHLPRGDDPMPDLHLVVPETLVVFDHFTHRATVTTLASADGSARDDADIVEALTTSAATQFTSMVDDGPFEMRAHDDESCSGEFRRAVAAAKAAIDEGDAYQVVVSQGRTIESGADPFDVYRALRSINPSPYMFFLDLGWGQLLGSSPELLAKLEGRHATVRPLAGTRARSGDPREERGRAAALRRDPKERAEHTMLVDLGRNDLGRVCTYGSVSVREFMGVELFSHVMHLVSEVCGELSADNDAFDLLRAAFPAGTVSGAPKIRALELIAELEGVRRGFYAGAVIRVGFDGGMDSCITLRSMHAYGDAFHVRAGAGVVADSDPAAEDRECAAKLGAALQALRMAREKAVC